MTGQHPTRFQWMRFLAGEHSADEARALEQHEATCSECAALVQEQRAIQEEGRHAAPRLSLAPRRPPLWRALWVPLAAATATLTLVWLVRDEGGSRTWRAKGPAVFLSALCKQEQRIWSCSSGEALAPRTAIQFEIALTEQRHVMLIGQDGSGKWDRFFPRQGDRAEHLGAGAHRLPFSLVLDETPGTERFYAFSARRAFSLAELRAAGVGQGEFRGSVLPLGVEVSAYSFLKKDVPR